MLTASMFVALAHYPEMERGLQNILVIRSSSTYTWADAASDMQAPLHKNGKNYVWEARRDDDDDDVFDVAAYQRTLVMCAGTGNPIAALFGPQGTARLRFTFLFCALRTAIVIFFHE